MARNKTPKILIAGLIVVFASIAACSGTESADSVDEPTTTSPTTTTTWPYPWPKGSPPPAAPGTTVAPAPAQKLIDAGYSDDEIAFAQAWCDGADPYWDPATDIYLDPTFALSPDQIHEVKGWLLLCPDNQYAKPLRAAIKRSQKVNQATARGERFFAGTYVIGKDIKPGTHVVNQASAGCYWERTDATGEIIDNNFVSGSTRVQVTSLPSDYSFTNEGCGEFVKQ